MLPREEVREPRLTVLLRLAPEPRLDTFCLLGREALELRFTVFALLPRDTLVPLLFKRAALPRVFNRAALPFGLVLSRRLDRRFVLRVGRVFSDLMPSRFAPGLIARDDDVRERCVIPRDLPLGTWRSSFAPPSFVRD